MKIDAALATASRSQASELTDGFANQAAKNVWSPGSRTLRTLNQAVPTSPIAATAR